MDTEYLYSVGFFHRLNESNPRNGDDYGLDQYLDQYKLYCLTWQ